MDKKKTKQTKRKTAETIEQIVSPSTMENCVGLAVRIEDANLEFSRAQAKGEVDHTIQAFLIIMGIVSSRTVFQWNDVLRTWKNFEDTVSRERFVELFSKYENHLSRFNKITRLPSLDDSDPVFKMN
jgi:hypothetical protein